MKTTTEHNIKLTATAIAVGVALFAVSGVGFAAYEARTPTLTAADDTAVASDAAITIDVLANDVDADPATLAIDTPPTQGTAVVTDGMVVYTPAEGSSGSDTFTYTVKENEWRTDEVATPYSLTVDSTAPIASSYTATSADGATISVPINDGTFPGVGFWNDSPVGDGVIGKSYQPSSTVAQIEGCNAGDDAGSGISLTMVWSGERRAGTAYATGGNQFTITTDAAPTPVKTDGDGIVLQVFQNSTTNITSSDTGSGSVVDDAGTAANGLASWKFTTTTTWPGLSGAEFEAMPITILASTYNNKTWYNSAISFEATVDRASCQLSTGTATVTISDTDGSGSDSDSSGGGGGSIDKIAIFALGLFGLNALRRRRQA